MSLTQLRIGMIGITGRGGLWRHWHDPQGRSVVVGAADIVPEYLAECRKRGILQVRIIHGKGVGTLRELVHAVLARLPEVASYRLADEAGGGWGATVVILKPKT